MKRNAFGEPQPATFEEIESAMAECELDPSDLQAMIHDSHGEAAPFTGWTVEIANAEDGELHFSTCGFDDLDALQDGLAEIGILLIEVMG